MSLRLIIESWMLSAFEHEEKLVVSYPHRIKESSVHCGATGFNTLIFSAILICNSLY